MLERCYARPKTVDRIRSSWLGAAIEQYATWFLERGHAPRDLGRRVPILLRFGTFAHDRGARRYEDLPPAVRIVGSVIQIQDLFQVRHELGIGLRRDHPVLDFFARSSRFFSVCRMVSWLIDATIPNLTTVRANSRDVQVREPSGGGFRRRALI